MARFARGSVTTLAAASRRKPSDLSRYSDHLLVDMGFERDWDGSLLRVVKD